MSAHFPTCPSSPEEGLKARLHYRLNGPWLKLLHVPFAAQPRLAFDTALCGAAIQCPKRANAVFGGIYIRNMQTAHLMPFPPRRFSRGMSPPLKAKFCRKRLSKHNCRQNDYLAQSPKRQGFSVPTCCSRCFCQGATRTFAHAIRCTNVGCVAVRAFCDYRLSPGCG